MPLMRNNLTAMAGMCMRAALALVVSLAALTGTLGEEPGCGPLSLGEAADYLRREAHMTVSESYVVQLRGPQPLVLSSYERFCVKRLPKAPSTALVAESPGGRYAMFEIRHKPSDTDRWEQMYRTETDFYEGWETSRTAETIIVVLMRSEGWGSD